MDQRERLNDLQEGLRALVNGHQARIWTALPGTIQSFDADAITCTVQPGIKALVRARDGSAQWVDLPLLVDVPVCFPRGGGCTLTFPVAEDDECLVVFSSRCIDGWWQAGGSQVQSELRMHDLSDGFALPGPFSQVTKIAGISTSSVQLRSNDASTYIDLNPTLQKVKIVAPGGFSVVAPLSTFSAAVTIGGLLTFVGGMVGSAASGAAAVFNGILNVIGQITANGKRVDDTHTHPDPQGGNTGPPN